jgi:hypothetical protein
LAVWRPLAVYLAILAGVVALSAQRLTALSLSAAPRALWGPFVRPLASAAFEMALLVAVPAAALAARASGLSWRATLLATALLLALSVSVAVGLDPGSVAPGHTAQQLLETARDACPSSPERRVQVPLVGLTWTCPKGARARISGPLPLSAKPNFAAASLRVSDDLRRIDATELELELPASRVRLGFRATVGRARVRGLPPWGRPAGRSTVSRLSGSLLASVAALATALAILPRLQLPWLGAAFLAALGGLCPLLANRALDRFGVPAFSYWLAVLAGPLGVALLALAVFGVRRALRGRSSVAGPAG